MCQRCRIIADSCADRPDTQTSHHRPSSPRAAPVRDIEPTADRLPPLPTFDRQIDPQQPVSPQTTTPVRVADTPKGLLIAKALASGQALPQDRPVSPTLPTRYGQQQESPEEVEEQQQDYQSDFGAAPPQMSAPGYASSKASSDSGASSAMDRWSQRRLQRLNTEHTFREQRQGGPQAMSSPSLMSSEFINNAYNSSVVRLRPITISHVA